MAEQVEHANLWVRSIAETVEFLTLALPSFRVRGGGTAEGGSKWVHVGTDTTYLSLNEADGKDQAGVRGRLNHIGFVVGNVEAVRRRLTEAGYKEGYKAPPHPHRKRLYFLDREGFDWEFVEYLSDDPAERNDYSL